MLPSKTHLAELADAAGFDLVRSEWFGDSYARTLVRWRERFEHVSREVFAQGFDERFVRMWRYYLAYCEAGVPPRQHRCRSARAGQTLRRALGRGARDPRSRSGA